MFMFIVVKYFGDPTYRKWVSDLFHLGVDTPMACVHILRDIIPVLSPPGLPSGDRDGFPTRVSNNGGG